jgi:hypothetical protein
VLNGNLNTNNMQQKESMSSGCMVRADVQAWLALQANAMNLLDRH